MANITRELEYAERIKVLEAENDRLRAEINEQNQIFRVLEKMYDDSFEELREAKKVLKDLIPIVSRAKKLIKE
jgi:flagellar motility protein MotE (MotC chaperone)